jgi:serine kinase of HPr protein (carbohydrate metabolism regulator)
MEEFRIRIAGYTAGVCSLFASTRDYCGRYLTEEAPRCHITVTREDLEFEQEFLRQEALEEGIKVRKFTDPFLERAAIQRKLADFLFEQDVLMTHGSTVAVDGKAYLFTAKCGTGKSTHTRLWRQVFGDRAVMVNDDKPFLKITEEGILACGSPWSGKHGLDSNISVPLKGICILHRGEENRIRRIGAEDAIEMLLHQSYVSDNTALQQKTFALVNRLTQCIPLWEMSCTKSTDAAILSHGMMSGSDQ